MSGLMFIDTSRDTVFVALARASDVVAERAWESGPDIGSRLLEAVDGLLREHGLALNEISRIAVHAGPARRTSALRAGVTVANLLAYTSGAELVVVAGDAVKEMLLQARAAESQDVVVPVY